MAGRGRGSRGAPPAPGHADLAGVWKYGFTDVRNVLERASARETAARVAGLARSPRRSCVPSASRSSPHVTQIASVRAPERDDLTLEDFAGVDESPVRCLDAETAAAMVQEINVLRKRNESLGGIFELRAFGLVPGLGSHVSWEERLDGRIGMALLSIQACKGVGLGDGFDLAGRPGSEAHDEIFYDLERGYHRETNQPGGLEGGMSTGEPLVVRCAMKPLPTLTKPLRSVDIATREPAQALRERTDSVVVPAAGVVGEAMLAIVLAGATGRSSAAITSTTCGRRSAPTKSGSGGSAGCLGERGARLHRLHGRREDDRGPCGGGGARGAGGRLRPSARGAPRPADRGLLRRARRGGVPRGRGAARVRAARGAAWPGDLARRRCGGPSACGPRSRGTPSCCSTSTRPPRGSAPAGAVRSPATASASPPCTPSAGRCTTASPTSCSPTRRATSSAARFPRSPRWRLGPACCGRAARPASIRSTWGAARSAAAGRRVAAGFLVTDETVGELYGGAVPGAAATIAIPPGEAAKTWSRPAGAARARGGRDGARRPRRGARRRRGRRPSPASARPPTSAASRSCSSRPRSSPRSTPPTAARPASTCRRARTTPAPTTSRPPSSPTRRCSRRCRPRSSRRAGRRSSRPR